MSQWHKDGTEDSAGPDRPAGFMAGVVLGLAFTLFVWLAWEVLR